MKKLPIKYTLALEKSPSYTTVRLQFGRDEFSRVKILGAMEWTRANTDTAYWEPNVSAYRLALPDLMEAGVMMGALLKAHAAGSRRDLFAWRDTLDKIGAAQVHYDKRTGGYELMADVKDANYARWRDNNVAIGEKYSCVGAMARDEDEARALMILEARKADYLGEFFVKWKAAGFPVMKLDQDYDQYEKPTTWNDVLPPAVMELKQLAA